MESSYPRRRGNYMCNAKREREKFLSRVILPAISGQKCPICLERLSDDGAALLAVCRHAFCLNCIRKWSELKRKCPLCNAEFDSWFYKINLYSRSFLHHHLLPLCRGRNSVAQTWRAPPRFLERSRAETNIGDRRTRPLPWRRSFGRSGSSAPSDVVAERKLEWRASVYHQRLPAVPLSSRDFLEQNARWNKFKKERMLEKIEPWIRRELQAILGDPDPSIIVHVVSAQFIARLESKFLGPGRQPTTEVDFLTPLRPFLRNQTDMFWHELRCFAESSLTMETYDAVVEYRQVD